MDERRPHLIARIVGGVIGAGGAYAVLHLTSWGPLLPLPAVLGAAALFGGLGLVFGPRIGEVVMQLF